MFGIIVAFPNLSDANKLKVVLQRNGFDDIQVFNSASQVIGTANELDSGIVICGYKLTDMHYLELYGYLPREISMLLVASKAKLDECMNQEIVCLGMPIHAMELVHTVETMMLEYRKREKKKKELLKPRRSLTEQRAIDEAKALLMERNGMSEGDAHRYIQKISMDSGNNMVETAKMILAINDR